MQGLDPDPNPKKRVSSAERKNMRKDLVLDDEVTREKKNTKQLPEEALG